MSSIGKHLKISEIIKEIIQEVGDLQNIEPYEFKGSSTQAFVTVPGFDEVEIFFVPIIGGMDTSSIPDVYNPENNTILQFGYSVDGKYTQVKKVRYTELVRILKTAVDFFEERLPYMLNRFGNFTIFVIGAQSKHTEDFISDPQKHALYHRIIVKNLPSTFRVNEVDLKILSGESKKSIIFQKIK